MTRIDQRAGILVLEQRNVLPFVFVGLFGGLAVVTMLAVLFSTHGTLERRLASGLVPMASELLVALVFSRVPTRRITTLDKPRNLASAEVRRIRGAERTETALASVLRLDAVVGTYVAWATLVFRDAPPVQVLRFTKTWTWDRSSPELERCVAAVRTFLDEARR